jgi:hypothetical protein
MSTTSTTETQLRDSMTTRLRQAASGAAFAAVQLAPKVKQLRHNASAWFAIRVVMGLLGAALVVLPLSFGYFLILPILGMALFLAAILLPPSPHEVSDEEVARELGAQWIVEGGDYQAGHVLGFPAKIFVGTEEVWVLDPLHRTLVVIPVAEIASANAEETGGKWAFRICWPGGEALFAYDGMFAEHLAKIAQDTVRGVMRRPEPPKAMARGAGA